jgi:hypothetical protein
VSAATNDTVYLNNPTTGLVVDSNVEVGGNLSVDSNVEVGGNLSVEGDVDFNGNLTMNTITVQTLFTLEHVVSQGNTTSNTVQFTNPTTALTATGNVEVGGELSVSGNVGVGTTEPTETLDIVGNLNLQKVSNTASIKLNSNVVTEFVRSKKLIKYPRVALTSAAENAYENGYKVTYSRYDSNYPAWKAFDSDPSDAVGWYSGGATNTVYNGTNGAYSGTTQLASETELGEWIGLEVPSPIKLYDVLIASQSYSVAANTVDDFVIYAKKQSGDTWTNLGKFTGIAARQGTSPGVTVNVNSSDYYKFFALVATKRDSQFVQGVSIRVLDFFGIPEYDPDADGTDVIVKSVPNVPNTDWLAVYYDGQDYTSMPPTITDKSGNGVTGTPSGETGFDTEYKAFTSSGSTTNAITATTSFSGSPSMSFSMWIKYDSFSSGDSIFYLLGTQGINNQMVWMSANSSGTQWKVANGGIGAYYLYNNAKTRPSLDTWIHVTVTYVGGSSYPTGITLYLNGTKEVPSSSNGPSALTLPSNSPLYLGYYYDSTTFFDGSIANFRLFNRDLSADEVWQLYAYQKEYFGYGNLGMALKSGRLGIATSEPSAQLDVQGTALFNGYVSINTPVVNEESPLTFQCALGGTRGLRIVRASGAGHWEITNQVFNDLVFSASSGGYGYLASGTNVVQIDFTGQHRSFIDGVPYTEYDNLEGLIVSANKNKYFDINEDITTGANAIQISQSLPLVSLSTKEKDKACFGVISGSEDPEKREYEQGRFVTGVQKQKGDQRAFINSVGEGAMWVTDINGPLESGDYITTSNVAGYGQKQGDDILHSYTVAKITMDCDFNPQDQPIQVIKKDEYGVNVLDEHGQLQWEEHPTETEKAYKIRYLDATGVQTDEANAVHTAAFVGCTYHCG